MNLRQVWIVDFGSQYTQLITRKTRELGYSCEIITYEESLECWNKGEKPSAIVLSGGPLSISADDNDYSFYFEEDIPLMGICYGMQIICRELGGKVEKGVSGEYGKANIHFTQGHQVDGCCKDLNVWMSHFDHVSVPPENFDVILESKNNFIAGIKHNTKGILGYQFHPEVDHTEYGKELLEYFYKGLARLNKDWSTKEMLAKASEVVTNVGRTKVLCAFSGGVDSLVAATLAEKSLGDDLHCFFVDNGLLRPQDHHHIKLLQKETNLNIEIINASKDFHDKTAGIEDPEKKRKAIGVTFIETFERKVHEYEEQKGIAFTHLLQGTLYPDVIESTSPHKKGGKSVTIKSHHNVGGLPEKMKLELLEPLRFLFKDEVRALGKELGLNPAWVHRHPFPGPGIGVRVLGELNPGSIKCVQLSDQILFEEMHNFELYDKIWQAFTVFLPVNTVGVKGDGRAYENVMCIRLVNSTDGMTATWCDVPYPFMDKVSSRITNEVSGITRVVYDVTSKPPGTIEWE
ncbi:MAG: glutamine-hydrolyzing GMP synthase [Bacteriovoracaceae bacterium]|jgi:GMP synthase (glutamine-hydrolysing)|nr:glutamine-hydrolyzing GMP synthase [Bacteriovoracaceae bacterium]